MITTIRTGLLHWTNKGDANKMGPGGSMSSEVGLPNNSYNPITNTAWVRTQKVILLNLGVVLHDCFFFICKCVVYISKVYIVWYQTFPRSVRHVTMSSKTWYGPVKGDSLLEQMTSRNPSISSLGGMWMSCKLDAGSSISSITQGWFRYVPLSPPSWRERNVSESTVGYRRWVQ